jgi:capsular exopolysaccharide synthesis family protein
MIPRVRVLGWVPDALEDPAGPGAIETAFRDRPRGVLAEAFRNTRSVMLKRMRAGGHKTLMVMAGMPGSGSTSIVANLALACSAVDQRVLIIDANFRRAGVHRAFGLSETGGVSDALSQGRDGVNLESVVQKTKDPRLDVVSAGSRDRRVFEMLSSDAMAELLRQAKERYDLILIDVAPAIVAGDGFALAQRVDASVLVVRALNEKRGMVARVKNDLSESQSDFLGVLVNGVRSSAGGYLKGNIRATHEYHAASEKSE